MRHQVAITLLYWLDHRTIGNLSGVRKSTVCGIVREVCEVMARVLLPKYINVPRKQHEVQGKIESFKSRAGFH